MVGMVTGWAVTWKLLVRVGAAIQEKTSDEPAVNGQENKSAMMGMRKFSEREQHAIQRMIDGTASSYSYVLVNIYNDIYFSRNVEFRYGKDKSHLVFYRADINQVSHDELLEIENEIMEISLLISYLQTNGLIYLVENTSVNEQDSAGGFLKDGLIDISMELDSNIARILYDSLNHRVFVGYTLRELAANCFMSIEERTLVEAKAQTQETHNMVGEAKRQAEAASEQAAEAKLQTQVAKRQTWLSLTALLLSFVSIIISVFSSIWVAKHITMDVKIDSAQVETITKQMSAIEERIDSLNQQMHKNHVPEDNTKVPMRRNNKKQQNK